MNATERIVESYFRIERKCFTITDIKIPKGNNRQIDILAYSLKSGECYHIEVGVTHCENWCADIEKLDAKFGYKFFGFPKNKRPSNPNTDYAKEKTYRQNIEKAYENYGFKPTDVIRVLCSWYFKEDKKKLEELIKKEANKYKLEKKNFEFLSFRDDVIPKIQEYIGTAHYDDEILRTFSLLCQYEKQKK